MDSLDESVITHMEVETNEKAEEFRKWLYRDVPGGEQQFKGVLLMNDFRVYESDY